MERGPKSVEFRAERERSWRRLETLVERVESDGIRSLKESELMELPVLHRAAVSALSVARAITLDRNLLEYLEGLTSRSYFCVYGVRREFLRTLRAFFGHRFPAAVRAAWKQVVLSMAFLFIGVLAGMALTLDDSDRYYAFVGEAMAQGRDPAASDAELRAVLYEEDVTAADTLTFFATLLFQHNTQVGILCFALGFAAGVPVFWLLFTNGLLLGAMGALYQSRGMGVDFWGWVMPHGVTELLAIVLCGAAGLLQGGAVLFPGRQSRLDSLKTAGRQAGTIVIGCVLLFFVAALIEGFFRQLVHSVAVRYATVFGTAVLWALYFFGLGTSQRPEEAR